ncbi:hypothetical protein [Streptomyces sp. NPDC051636]|uniref:hypothetical protein n=1 Tax=Streptomyces sp. NPDC051636 TaxID=3365663 RepID=UPI00378EF800
MIEEVILDRMGVGEAGSVEQLVDRVVFTIDIPHQADRQRAGERLSNGAVGFLHQCAGQPMPGGRRRVRQLVEQVVGGGL